MTNIAGIFDSYERANDAYANLVAAGFDARQTSLLVSEKGRERIFTNATKTNKGAHDAARGALAGAVGVGALAALVGALTAIIIGPGVLAAGPLFIALSSAAGGAVVGSLSGALVEAGFSHDEAGEYAEALEAGKAVIVIHDVEMSRADEARAILSGAGAAAAA